MRATSLSRPCRMPCCARPSGNAFENTVEQLARAIRLGVLADGEQLPPERDLAERLGVSRNTLREAIAALRDSGLVTTRRGRGGGTVVTYAGRGRRRRHAASRARPSAAVPRWRTPSTSAGSSSRARPGWRPRSRWPATSAPGSPSRAARVDDAADVDATGSPTPGCTSRSPPSRLADGRRGGHAGPGRARRAARPDPGAAAATSSTPTQQHDQVVAAILAGDADTARTTMEEHCDATSALLRGLIG